MPLVLRSGPAIEPVTVAEAKAHLRIDGTAEDILIASLILTSRLHVEAALDLALVNQSWTLMLDKWPRETAPVEIPMSPLQSIDAVRVKNASGTAIAVSSSTYLVDIASRPARLVWNGAPRPDPGIAANGIEIDFSAGFGATAGSVPAPLRHAVLLLTAHWYEHRDPVEVGSDAARIPAVISELIQPFRKFRL